MKYKLAAERFLVKIDPLESQSKGGMVLTTGENEHFHTGTIMEIGSGIKETIFKVGDKCFFNKKKNYPIVPLDDTNTLAAFYLGDLVGIYEEETN